MSRERVSCGRDCHNCTDINGALEQSCKNGFDFVCLPLVNPRLEREFVEGPAKDRAGPLTRSDMCLTSSDWSSLVVGKLSPWLQTDSLNETVRKNSERAIKQELMFASHLCVPSVMVPVKKQESYNLARILNEHILQGNNHQYWIHMPIQTPEDEVAQTRESGQGECAEQVEKMQISEEDSWKQDTWKWWITLYTLCENNKRMGLALELTADLPSDDIIDRWAGEPVKAVVVPTSIFLSNKKGFPVLSKAHQNALQKFFKLDVQLIVKGSDHHADKGIRTYYQYLDHIYKNQDCPDVITTFSKGYEDYLQCPLQPLMDNLESQTYEVFEKDPVKYACYQKAIYQALLDRVPPEERETNVQVVMVLGAGRGPIVRSALAASQKAGVKVKVFAVEKNPNAVVTLENLKYEMWGDQVTVVSSDMRHWETSEKADIIVSELLGSFGDNELSPECLDGAQKFLKDDGISIPKEYTSFVSPITSSKLWNEARICKDPTKHPDAHFETPYVVRLHTVYTFAKPLPLFTFHHPNKGVIDNRRYGSLKFTTKEDTIIHGFAGYFECPLYGDVLLSTVPETHTPNMFSWFPIYFPIKEPMFVKKGETIEILIWRCVSSHNVWYEWAISQPQLQHIHNAKGRSYTIGL